MVATVNQVKLLSYDKNKSRLFPILTDKFVTYNNVRYTEDDADILTAETVLVVGMCVFL